MTRLFSKVSPAVWGSSRFMGLPTNEAKLLYLYLLTNEHLNSAGAYRLKEGYALADLGWQPAEYRNAMAMLVAAGLIAHDDDTSEVYILRWFKHNPPQNEKHSIGCNRVLNELDSESISALAFADFQEADTNRLANSGKVSNSLMERLKTGSGGRGR